MAAPRVFSSTPPLNLSSRHRITVNGIVQGVGFRPFVAGLAERCKLHGFVANTSHGVTIEIEGGHEALKRFSHLLRDQAPSPALIYDIAITQLDCRHDSGFAIVPSDPTGSPSTLVAPDLCLCNDCLQELFDRNNRRYGYPFINCTHCGPRYTIITSIPYDRPATAMAAFTMCPSCRAEYDDPQNRRYHAQPNACPACGPRVDLCDVHGQPLAGGNEVFAAAADLLADGKILAIKGLGGFHLAVDAQDDRAVIRLRDRKGRRDKPFALMVADLDMARKLCHLTPESEALLTSVQRPIVLLPRIASASVGSAVAPAMPELGVMLPYTPLHHLLFHAYRKPLIMTSGNRSEEPLCIDNQEAMEQLGSICDAFLLHNRDIVCRADDSVVLPSLKGPLVLRRSRGYSPGPIIIDGDGPQVLAVGAELKNTVCLLKGRYAFLSQHLGDLKNLSAANFFREAITRVLTLFAGQPELVVHDLHPGYLSSQWAAHENLLPTLAVQHHHAHLAACLAENRQPGPAIGVILDGTGYGPDGTIWGGEILIGDFSGYRRYAFFEPMPLPGSDLAIREPWRTAVGYLTTIFGRAMPELDFLAGHDWQPVAEIAGIRRYSPPTSSCGRLFDAVAALTGGRQSITYEGQAAIELMTLASRGGTDAYDLLPLQETHGGYQMMVSPILRQIVADVQAGTDPANISAAFHNSLIGLLCQAVTKAASATGLNTVVLSGGVFANRILFEGLHSRLSAAGLTIFSHIQTPPGDGCIALGQAAIGRHYLQHNRRIY